MSDKKIPNAPIGLAEMIDALRQELLDAQEKAKHSLIMFEVENIDLELKVNVTRTTKVDGGLGVKFWVVNVDSNGEQANTVSTLQTIKLSLSVKDKKKVDKHDGGSHAVNVRG